MIWCGPGSAGARTAQVALPATSETASQTTIPSTSTSTPPAGGAPPLPAGGSTVALISVASPTTGLRGEALSTVAVAVAPTDCTKLPSLGS